MTNPIGNGVHNVINAFWIGFLKAFDALSGIMGLPVTGKAEKTEKSYIGCKKILAGQCVATLARKDYFFDYRFVGLMS